MHCYCRLLARDVFPFWRWREEESSSFTAAGNASSMIPGAVRLGQTETVATWVCIADSESAHFRWCVFLSLGHMLLIFAEQAKALTQPARRACRPWRLRSLKCCLERLTERWPLASWSAGESLTFTFGKTMSCAVLFEQSSLVQIPSPSLAAVQNLTLKGKRSACFFFLNLSWFTPMPAQESMLC